MNKEINLNKSFSYLNKGFIFLVLLTLVTNSVFSRFIFNFDAANDLHSIDKRIAKSDFHTQQLHNKDNETVRTHLFQKCKHLKNSKCELVDGPVIESPYSRHLLFFQALDGIRIFRAEIKINLNLEGAITSVFDNSVGFKSIAKSTFPDSARLRVLLNSLYNHPLINIECLYFPEGDELIPSVRATVFEASTGNFTELVYTGQEDLIYQHDLNYHYTSSPDTIVKARVFLPDPLTTAHVIYGAPYAGYKNPASPYRNHNDSDIVELNAQRFLVKMHVSLDKDTFRLKNKYAVITEFADPVVAPVFSNSPDFSFTRAQSGFDDVNAFFHINAMHKHLLDMGFSNVANSQIQVDSHVYGDNSKFSYATSPPRLEFGTGGVPDAQDADVIVHEYGHFINYSIAPNSNSGAERMTIDEANCDYLAASYSRVLDSFMWQNVFNWDGHNEYWTGRVVQSAKKYASNLNYSSVYANAEIWSSSLMEIWETIGRDTTDKILIQSMYGYAINMRMPDAAKLLLNADSLLYAGRHASAITNIMTARGIFANVSGLVSHLNNNSEIKIINSMAFAEGNGPLLIKGGENKNLRLKVFSISGTLLYDEEYAPGSNHSFDKYLGQGFFIFKIQEEEKTYCFKIAKF
jgi:hypothetical protein